jgi:hypothetical protein
MYNSIILPSSHSDDFLSRIFKSEVFNNYFNLPGYLPSLPQPNYLSPDFVIIFLLYISPNELISLIWQQTYTFKETSVLKKNRKSNLIVHAWAYPHVNNKRLCGVSEWYMCVTSRMGPYFIRSWPFNLLT